MQASRHNSFLALLIGIAGWLVPGGGHLLLRMWTRGLGVFAMVAALAWTGIALRGRLFTFTTDDFFDLLGFFADCGAGSFFYFVMKYNNGGPDVAHAAGDRFPRKSFISRSERQVAVFNLGCIKFQAGRVAPTAGPNSDFPVRLISQVQKGRCGAGNFCKQLQPYFRRCAEKCKIMQLDPFKLFNSQR